MILGVDFVLDTRWAAVRVRALLVAPVNGGTYRQHLGPKRFEFEAVVESEESMGSGVQKKDSGWRVHIHNYSWKALQALRPHSGECL